MRPKKRPALRPSALPWLLALGSCGGGGDGASALPPGRLDLLIEDGPPKDLVAFHLTVDQVRLLGSGGNPKTKNLLDGSRRVELLGLEGEAAWLASVSVPPGTYGGVRLGFVAGSLAARAKDGTTVPLTTSVTQLDLAFAAPVEVTGKTDYDRVTIDVDLEESLTGDLAGMDFAPEGRVADEDGTSLAPVDELRGVLSAVTAFGTELELELYADDDLVHRIGTIPVLVDASTALFDELGAPYADASAFFAALIEGETLLEVHGSLSTTGDGEDPRLVARIVFVEDHNQGDNVEDEVKLTGLVAATASGDLELLWSSVEKGAAVADPVIAGLGDPATLTFDLLPGTPFLDTDGTDLTPAALAVGQRIEVLSGDFSTPPFAIERLVFARAPTGEASVVQNLGAGSFVVHVAAAEPWVTSGEVADDLTDVTVDATTAALEIDTEARPAFDPADLAPGQLVRVRGALDSGSATITAEEVLVHAGRLRGQVTATTPPTTFTATLQEFLDPFGDQVGQTGPYTIEIDAGCAFEGDAASAQELMDLFANLGGGESITVEVRGFDDGSAADTIQALELEVDWIVP